ncbi:hypothetical protein ACIQVC_18475 [Streptomyces sp. NPDC101112]|uniref:hypothetical protein n=1 Tax=Streptomyces sp. NPDC101112 TaxID=3366105 RepID=UPI00381FA819
MLSEFRDRLVADRAPRRLLELVLERLQEAGLLVRPGGQRTDSTHVLAAVRRLNRVENTAEHLRSTLNALAAAVGDWLRRTVSADWFDRYQRRIEDYRLPRGEGPRRQYMQQTGEDGIRLLTAINDPEQRLTATDRFVGDDNTSRRQRAGSAMRIRRRRQEGSGLRAGSSTH